MSLATLYLGNPLSPFGMQAISPPPPGSGLPQSGSGSGGVSTNLSRGTVAQSLISGGVSIQRKPRTKSGFQIAWNLLGMSDVELLMSFFDGRQGGGPYCLVDPSWTNFFPPNVAGMGSVIGALPEWSPSAGTLAVSTAAGPAGVLSGVAQWSSAVTGSVLYAGLNNIIDGTWLPPVVSGVSVRAAIYAKLVSGSCALTAAATSGLAGSAPSVTLATGSAITLSSGSWQEVPVAVANNYGSYTSSTDYVMPKWTVSSATTPVILLSAPYFIYDLAVGTPGVTAGQSAVTLTPWAGGVGVPRVVIVGDAPSAVDLIGLREYTLTLQEI